jgi:hypothetical protein
MKKKLNTPESSEQKKEKKSVWYHIFHWALVFYFFAAVIALFYGGYLFLDYLVTSIKNWV